jgi:hypothetical protein
MQISPFWTTPRSTSHKFHGFFQVVVFTLSYEFTVDVHHTSSPLGHCKELEQRKRGLKAKCTAICPKETRNPTLYQGPHNPTIECQPLERDCNE